MIAYLVLAGVFGCFCFLALFAICALILDARLNRPKPHQFAEVLDLCERAEARRQSMRGGDVA